MLWEAWAIRRGSEDEMSCTEERVQAAPGFQHVSEESSWRWVSQPQLPSRMMSSGSKQTAQLSLSQVPHTNKTKSKISGSRKPTRVGGTLLSSRDHWDSINLPKMLLLDMASVGLCQSLCTAFSFCWDVPLLGICLARSFQPFGLWNEQLQLGKAFPDHPIWSVCPQHSPLSCPLSHHPVETPFFVCFFTNNGSPHSRKDRELCFSVRSLISVPQNSAWRTLGTQEICVAQTKHVF